MTSTYQTIGFDWHGIAVSVTFDPDRSPSYRKVYGHPLWHLQISSAYQAPLPITETGYRSAFVSGHVMASWDGPVDYVQAWLEDAAADPAWRVVWQLPLF